MTIPKLTTEQKAIITQIAIEHEEFDMNDWVFLPIETDDPTTITL